MKKFKKERSLDELLKERKLPFSPVLRKNGKRVYMEIWYGALPSVKKLGFHGNVQDLLTGKWYAVYGKECDIPDCICDAWAEEIDSSISKEFVPFDPSKR